VIVDLKKQLLKIAGDLCGPQRPKRSQRELFHYTDLQGFLGIVDGRSLWASDMLCLEDASEASYAYRLIKRVLNRDFASIPRAHREHFLMMLVEGGFLIYAPFVACFCEDGDLLSQWRGYGGNGEGLALAFKVDWLSSLRRSGFELRRVIYRPDDQVELISKYLQGVVDLLQHRNSSADDARWLWALASSAAEDLIAIIKDPAFEQEQEWRLVNLHMQDRRKIKYRRSGSRVVPYMLIPIEPRSIAAVVRGPYFAGTESRGIRQILHRRGFPEASARVQDSKVPIRR
jgi:hypothetical protein